MGICFGSGDLSKYTIENTPKYDFKNQTRYCKVLDCYDGDTITVAIKLEKNVFKMKVRMMGYDSPEMKPSLTQYNREKEVNAAKKAKKALEDKILNKIVKINIHGFDKYGRLLGTIYLENYKNVLCISCICFKEEENINDFMINNNYGYKYNGGKKQKFKT